MRMGNLLFIQREGPASKNAGVTTLPFSTSSSTTEHLKMDTLFSRTKCAVMYKTVRTAEIVLLQNRPLRFGKLGLYKGAGGIS